VTFEDNRDDEIQCGSCGQSKTQLSYWQGPKQQCFNVSARVLFTTFRSYLSPGLNCWVHSHKGCEPVTSTRGLCQSKKSEQAGCIASAQTCGLCHDNKSERAGCIASAQMSLKELLAGIGLRSENSISLAAKTKSNIANRPQWLYWPTNQPHQFASLVKLLAYWSHWRQLHWPWLCWLHRPLPCQHCQAYWSHQPDRHHWLWWHQWPCQPNPPRQP
jgi:hypothetical protein